MGKYVTSKIKGHDNITVNFSDAFKGMEQDLRDSVRDAAVDAFSSMVKGTPVETGYARDQWSVDLLKEDATVGEKLISNYDFKNLAKGKDGFSQTLQNLYRSADQIIEENIPRLRRLGNKNLNGFNIKNTAPYIGELEKGHSSQNKYWIRRAAKRLAGAIGFATGGVGSGLKGKLTGDI